MHLIQGVIIHYIDQSFQNKIEITLSGNKIINSRS